MALPDLAARLTQLQKRIGRLETLEFGTTAFPAGTGVICDITTVGAVASVTCPVPLGIRHLLAIIAAGLDTTGLTIPKIRVTLSGLVAGYQYLTRQENLFVIGDTKAVAEGIGVSAPFMETLRPSHRQTFPPSVKQRNSGTFLFPDPDIFAFQARTDIANTAGWIGAGRMRSTGPLVLGLVTGDDLGGGFNNGAPVGPITSITWTAPPATTFIAGSRFTVYAL